ncbi:tol-pal system protein YbgF [Pseudorhodoplanes sinuspersici]|uniref:Cell division coordinator CpoB n=1 Tax=Pseudorhodoplanes sinuspersici TaxID=1235591 RepID=A0A1W6ZLS1_9HYPH|nr:tol-pal system protein YbgF [Pseudorhodoplanes sinuspersici]ARP98336.1 tol-pal system protein YbgF [Pseudorhodoplanes sinuspersici]RKE65995.1 tol-pal system protein YbgF [Pseudorhodoplanes sinuspersici]
MRLKPHFFVMGLSFLLVGAVPATAQMSASDVVMRLDALENQIRQLTGQVEQLQYRNQQLEQQLRRTTEDNEYRFQELGGKGGSRAPQRQQAQPPTPQGAPQTIPGRRSDIDPGMDQRNDPRMNDPRAADPRFAQRSEPRVDQRDNQNFVPAPNVGGRRGDAFDPNANPTAPGAPRALGSLPPGQPSVPPRYEADDDDNDAVGARGGREPGQPLDLSTMANNAVNDPSLRRGGGVPTQRNMSGTGAVASVSPPGDSPRDHFDLGYGYVQRKDYASAEQTFRDFLQRYPNDRMAPEVNYWLGESLFQRQRYQDAAEAYLVVTTKYETAGKAPDALLRLGQSLAAIGQKEMACASFAEVGRKYPRSSVAVKQGVEREQKRVRC